MRPIRPTVPAGLTGLTGPTAPIGLTEPASAARPPPVPGPPPGEALRRRSPVRRCRPRPGGRAAPPAMARISTSNALAAGTTRAIAAAGRLAHVQHPVLRSRSRPPLRPGGLRHRPLRRVRPPAASTSPISRPPFLLGGGPARSPRSPAETTRTWAIRHRWSPAPPISTVSWRVADW